MTKQTSEPKLFPTPWCPRPQRIRQNALISIGCLLCLSNLKKLSWGVRPGPLKPKPFAANQVSSQASDRLKQISIIINHLFSSAVMAGYLNHFKISYQDLFLAKTNSRLPFQANISDGGSYENGRTYDSSESRASGDAYFEQHGNQADVTQGVPVAGGRASWKTKLKFHFNFFGYNFRKTCNIHESFSFSNINNIINIIISILFSQYRFWSLRSYQQQQPSETSVNGGCQRHAKQRWKKSHITFNLGFEFLNRFKDVKKLKWKTSNSYAKRLSFCFVIFAPGPEESPAEWNNGRAVWPFCFSANVEEKNDEQNFRVIIARCEILEVLLYYMDPE